jgi:hypothetical protein
MAALGVDFLEDIQQIASWLTLPSVVVRILGDALPCFDEEPIIPVAIEHNPLPVGQLLKVVLRNLLGDDKATGTELLGDTTFQLDETAE